MVHRLVALGCLLLAVDLTVAAEPVDSLRDVKPILMPGNPGDHWAFRLPVKSPVAARGDPDWQANPIDAFLAAAYQRQGLKATPPASKDLLQCQVDPLPVPLDHLSLYRTKLPVSRGRVGSNFPAFIRGRPAAITCSG